MDEEELRVLGEPPDAPAEVWQAAVAEALSRPLDESLADLLTWDGGPGPDGGLDTGWEEPAHGNGGWEAAPALPEPGTDLSHSDFGGAWAHDPGPVPLAEDDDDPVGGDPFGQDSGGLDAATGHNETDTWLDPGEGFDGS